MRSLGPAGWASHGFFGFRAKTFGNPTGATSGNGGPQPNPAATFVNHGISVPGPGVPIAMASDATGHITVITSNGNTFQALGGGASWEPLGTIAGFGSTQPEVQLAQSPVGGVGGGVLLVPMEADASILARSVDFGEAWTTGIASGTATAGAMTLVNDNLSHWISIGNIAGSVATNVYAQSIDDGQTWSQASNVTSISGTDYPFIPTYDGTQFIVPSNNGVANGIWTSANGNNWTFTPLSDSVPGEFLGSVYLVGGTYHSGSQEFNQVYSGDSIADLCSLATTAEVPLFSGIQFLLLSGATWFALDATGAVATSTDFVTWTAGNFNAPDGEVAVLAAVSATTGQVIAITESGYVLSCP